MTFIYGAQFLPAGLLAGSFSRETRGLTLSEMSERELQATRDEADRWLLRWSRSQERIRELERTLTVMYNLIRLEDYSGEKDSNYHEARRVWWERARETFK